MAKCGCGVIVRGVKTCFMVLMSLHVWKKIEYPKPQPPPETGATCITDTCTQVGASRTINLISIYM